MNCCILSHSFVRLCLDTGILQKVYSRKEHDMEGDKEIERSY